MELFSTLLHGRSRDGSQRRHRTTLPISLARLGVIVVLKLFQKCQMYKKKKKTRRKTKLFCTREAHCSTGNELCCVQHGVDIRKQLPSWSRVCKLHDQRKQDYQTQRYSTMMAEFSDTRVANRSICRMLKRNATRYSTWYVDFPAKSKLHRTAAKDEQGSTFLLI